jgi:CheY-like chemotaxis protein
MGLSMVHGLAAQSGGRLVLKSRKGEGTTAEIWLPAIQVPAIAPAEAARKADATSPELRIKALTILVVDDDALVLQSTAAMLADLGHRVLEASSGHEALEYLGRAQSVDLVITDHAMPGMTGMQLAATIKQRWPHLPVILASGYTDLPPNLDGSLIRLSKPFRQDRLAQVISESTLNASAGKVIRLRPR